MRRSPKAIRLLTAAAGAVVFSSVAYGAGPTLSTFYTSGETAQDINFSVNTQTVSISNTSPIVHVPLGDYFEFGISMVLSNNPNPDAGEGNPAQPSYLGLGIVNYTVESTDTGGTTLAPLFTGSYAATDVFTNTTPSIQSPGDAEPEDGVVGANETIEEGDFSIPTATTAAGVTRLALWSGALATAADATPFFIDLGYRALSTGIVELSPGPNDNGNGTDYYSTGGTHTAQNPYGYELSDLGPNGAVDPAPSLAVYIAPSLIWDGQADHTTWNTGVANWNFNSNTTSTYSNPDFVTFDDTAPSNSTNISLATTVSPYLVTVNGNTNNYSISGSGSIAGPAALVKSGNSTLTLSTSNTFTGGTTVNAGTLIVNTNGALSSNDPLTINNSSKVKLAASTGQATLSSLSISSGGTLDIANNHVFIDYGATDPKATIIQYLATGAAGGKWNGPGIDSSAAAANSSYGVGFADSADGVDPSLSSDQIELKYTLYGDINLDGVVNGTDFGILAANFNKGATNGWEQGDFLYAGVVNGADFGLLAANFNKGDSGTDISDTSNTAALDAFAAANGLLADVPEPGAFALLALTTTCLLVRRRRVTSR